MRIQCAVVIVALVWGPACAIVDCPNNNGNGNVAFSLGFRSMSYNTAVSGGFIMDASPHTPVALATRPRGGLLVVDAGSLRVRSVNTTGFFGIEAGAGWGAPNSITSGFVGDGLSANADGVRLLGPQGVASDPATGHIWIFDTASANCRVRFINGSTGNISTIFGDASANAPTEFPEGSRVTSTSACGQPKHAFFYRSQRFTKWNNSVFYVDSKFHVVRVLTENMASYTVAGKVPLVTTNGYTGDRGPATSAQLKTPTAVAVADGEDGPMIFIADSGNNVIRLVLPNGTITTFAGTGAASYSGDRGPAVAATLNAPLGVAYDGLRNITYIADTGNNAIRAVLPNGTIVLVAGRGTQASVQFQRDHTSAPGLDVSIPSPGAMIFEQNAEGGRLFFLHGATSARFVKALMCASPCPGGMICSQDGRVISGCPGGVVCEPGTLNVFGVDTYRSCGPDFGAVLNGFYCPINASARILTPPGYFNNNFLPVAPRPCLAGNYCPKDPLTGRYRTWFPCPSGSFSGPLQTNCTVCPAGTYCTQPDAGTGVVEPELCTPGRYCAENATTLWGHGPCAEGYLCPAGTGTPTPASSKCPAGWYCASGSSSPSSLCQPGYYCPEGSSSPRSYLCPAGSFCYAGSAEPALCPAGSWSSTPGRFTACNLCPASTYSGAVGATNYTSCKDCPAGFQCPSAGMAAPLPCPAGAKSAPTGLSCVECPAGTFNQMPGNNASDPCSPCPAGHICRAGTVYPEGCPAGTQPAFIGAAMSCVPCMAGTYNPVPQGSCQPCPAGSACSVGASRPERCPAGYYVSEDATSCVACPPGTYNPFPQAANASACTPCPSGFITGAPGAASSIFCYEAPFYCPPGFEPTVLKPRTVADCRELRCSPGLVISPERTSCIGCAPGSFGTPPGCTPCNATRGEMCPGFTLRPLLSPSFVMQELLQSLRALQGRIPAAGRRLTAGPGESACEQAAALSQLPIVAAKAPPLVSSTRASQITVGVLSAIFFIIVGLTFVFAEAPSLIPGRRGSRNSGTQSQLAAAAAAAAALGRSGNLGPAPGAAQENNTQSCGSRLLKRVDAFGMKHQVKEGTSPVKRSTALGGAFSIAAIVALLAIWSIIVLQREENNIIESSAVDGLSEDALQSAAQLPAASVGGFSGLYFVVSAVGDGSKCLNATAAATGLFTGSATVTSSMCGAVAQHVISCPDCVVGPESKVTLDLDFSCQGFLVQAYSVAPGPLASVRSLTYPQEAPRSPVCSIL